MKWKEELKRISNISMYTTEYRAGENFEDLLMRKIEELIEQVEKEAYERGLKTASAGLLESNSNFVQEEVIQAKIEVLEELKKKSHSTVADYQVAILYEEDIDDMLSKLKEEKK